MPLILLTLTLAAPAAAEAPFDPFSQVTVDPPEDAAVPPDATFRDAAGRTVRLGDLLGDVPVVLAPVYYTCPNVCGVTLGGLFAALDNVPLDPGADYRVIALGIHAGDTPADAAAAKDRALGRLDRADAGPAVHFLTGDEAEIRRVTDAIGFRFAWDERIRQYAHAAGVAVLTPDGRFARWLAGVAFQPTDLRLGLVEAGRGEVGGLADRLLLLCYYYDPATGQYNGLVQGGLRIAGSLTVAALAGFIGLALWRDRRRRQREAG